MFCLLMTEMIERTRDEMKRRHSKNNAKLIRAIPNDVYSDA